jgi:cellulose synthase/poly-beta-1,6-N-acetylglucosamine synthase-like glycosyltransferase
MEFLFWVSLGLVLYVYAGYPVVLEIWRRIGRRPPTVHAAATPPVSVVIAARNEAERLPGRIENLLGLDYPPSCLEIVVVSDAAGIGTVDAAIGRAPPAGAVD